MKDNNMKKMSPIGMNNMLLIIIITLIIGGSLGFVLAKQTQPKEEAYDMGGMHTMSQMDHSMMGMMNELEDKSGKQLDKAFLEEMIVHHEGAVDMANIVLEKSENKELKDFANNIIETQSKEINQMNKWLDEWFK
jgi:uncharacterized protein (DUF305 family)